MILIKKQSGAVLMIGMMMLVVLSLIVISASRTTLLQQKMSNNLRDKELANQAAESALKEGEAYLIGADKKTLSGIFDGNNGLHTFDSSKDMGKAAEWNNKSIIESEALFQVAEKSVYFIEELPEISAVGNSMDATNPSESAYYRITAKASGGTESSIAIVQSMLKK